MPEEKCGLRSPYKLRDYQERIANTVLNEVKDESKRNFFIALLQGTGKTIIALHVLAELVNNGKMNNVLVILPRTVLVDQWVERAQEKFYGLKIMKNPTISRKSIVKIRGWLKHSGARGIAMTMHSFKNFVKRKDFSEHDFDIVIVDEAMDIVARDFIERFRISSYHIGLEKWNIPKIFLLPYQVKEERLVKMIKKFGEDISHLIHEDIKDPSQESLAYTIPDPILIDDPVVNMASWVLDDEYKQVRKNVLRILKKHGIEGYTENLETLLDPRVIKRLKKKYGVKDETVKHLQTLISKYILTYHIKKWFLYSNREELSRSILASQKSVKEWLSREDKKLTKLSEVVRSLIDQNKKVYIFSQYIATAELIFDSLKSKLSVGDNDVTIVTGADQEMQYLKLDQFKETGRILISTPVFDKGTDIPEADVIIPYTPPLSKESLFQVVGRIRGGEVLFLTYKGYEETIMKEVVDSLRKGLGVVDINGTTSYI